MRLSHFVCALLLVCAVPGIAADVTGSWSGYPLFLVLKQQGNILTGTLGPNTKEQYPFTEGGVEGDRLWFTIGSLKADLHVEGDEIRGTMSKGEQTMKAVFKRFDANAAPPSFEVASVKRGAPSTDKGTSSSSRLAPGRITFTNVNLKRLIMRAYELKVYQVTGPDWMDSENYDIVATFPASSGQDQVLGMLRSLLTERFQLAFHHETKELPVYALVVDKAGMKLKPAEPLSDGTSMNSGPKGRKLTGNMSLARLAEALFGGMDRPVIDFTGVKGIFEVSLEWTPDDTKPVAGEVLDGQSIYSALRPLGLKLEPRKAPVEVMVVDRIEKNPVEN